jgi:hypothetical protein
LSHQRVGAALQWPDSDLRTFASGMRNCGLHVKKPSCFQNPEYKNEEWNERDCGLDDRNPALISESAGFHKHPSIPRRLTFHNESKVP